MPKKLYKENPVLFAVCQLKECTVADKCLRQLSFETTIEKKEIINMVSPKKCSKNKDCKFFKDSEPVKFARGFIKIQKQMLPDQYMKFMSILISTFGRNPYYERRRGEAALTPKEQEIILNTLKEVGFTGKAEFDSYEENSNWYQ